MTALHMLAVAASAVQTVVNATVVFTMVATVTQPAYKDK
jgi:hypothetical protein